MKKSNNKSYSYFLLRQFILSVIVSSIPISVTYVKSSNPHLFIKSVNMLIADNTTQSILVAIGILYAFASIIKSRFYTYDDNLKCVLSFTYGIIMKLASNFESILQLFTGTLMVLGVVWYFIDPQSFDWKLCLAANLCVSLPYLLISAGLDMLDNNRIKPRFSISG